MKVKSEREVTQSCPTLSDPMDRSLPGSSVHGIFQARVLEWGAIAFSVLLSYWNTNTKKSQVYEIIYIINNWMVNTGLRTNIQEAGSFSSN